MLPSLNIQDEGTRKWVYEVFVATLPLLAAASVITESHIPLWAGLFEAVIVGSLAIRNTNRTPKNAGNGTE